MLFLVEKSRRRQRGCRRTYVRGNQESIQLSGAYVQGQSSWKRERKKGAMNRRSNGRRHDNAMTWRLGIVSGKAGDFIGR